MLRVSVATSTDKGTPVGWSLVANDTDTVLFKKGLGDDLQYPATYADEFCIDSVSCHVLSIYSPWPSDAMMYHITLDGKPVESQDSTGSLIGKTCSTPCPLEKIPLRLEVHTCEPTVSWEILDSSGKIIVSNNGTSGRSEIGALPVVGSCPMDRGGFSNSKSSTKISVLIHKMIALNSDYLHRGGSTKGKGAPCSVFTKTRCH